MRQSHPPWKTDSALAPLALAEAKHQPHALGDEAIRTTRTPAARPERIIVERPGCLMSSSTRTSSRASGSPGVPKRGPIAHRIRAFARSASTGRVIDARRSARSSNRSAARVAVSSPYRDSNLGQNSSIAARTDMPSLRSSPAQNERRSASARLTQPFCALMYCSVVAIGHTRERGDHRCRTCAPEVGLEAISERRVKPEHVDGRVRLRQPGNH